MILVRVVQERNTRSAMGNNMDTLEERVQKIEVRNVRVQADKA